MKTLAGDYYRHTRLIERGASMVRLYSKLSMPSLNIEILGLILKIQNENKNISMEKHWLDII